MARLKCKECGETIQASAPGIYRCAGCGERNRYNRGDVAAPEPWFIQWTVWVCYAHLILMCVFTPLALIGEFIASLLTVGIALPFLAAHFAFAPFTVLLGLVPLIVVDSWRAQARVKPAGEETA